MKNSKMMIALLAAMMLVSVPLAGCRTLGGDQNWRDNIPRLKADTFMFSKLATRVVLSEASMQAGDVVLLENYLVALRDLLAVPGQPNFNGARALVSIKLPQKYQVYGLTLIDVLERYVSSANLNITDDQEAILAIISAGIDGSLEAVQEFAV